MTARKELALPGLAQRLRELRAAKGVSQSAVARALGITPSAWNKVEGGVGEPSLGQMCALAELLDFGLDEVLGPLYRDRKESAGRARSGTSNSSSTAKKSSRERTTR